MILTKLNEGEGECESEVEVRSRSMSRLKSRLSSRSMKRVEDQDKKIVQLSKTSPEKRVLLYGSSQRKRG